MADDVKALSAELARDPGSPVFLQLGEALRARGQPEAARLVVVAGLERRPSSVPGRDLLARILADAGDLTGAEREWGVVLASDPRHLGAHKGLGFLCYRRGDVDGALDHLELALSVDPADQSVVQALHTVRAAATGGVPPASAPPPAAAEPASAAVRESRAPPAPPAAAPSLTAALGPTGRTTTAVFAGLGETEHGLLLVDHRGLLLGGGLRAPDGRDVGEAVAAHLAGVSQEAARTARMLELGEWRWVVAEAPGGNMFLGPASPEAVLLVVRDHTVPAGRLAALAEKAGAAARRWLEVQSL